MVVARGRAPLLALSLVVVHPMKRLSGLPMRSHLQRQVQQEVDPMPVLLVAVALVVPTVVVAVAGVLE